MSGKRREWGLGFKVQNITLLCVGATLSVHYLHYILITCLCMFLFCLVGPYPHRDRDYCIWSNFWKFYLIRTSFTLGESVSLVKVFRLFKLEQMVFGVQSVDTVGGCTNILFIGSASMFVTPGFEKQRHLAKDIYRSYEYCFFVFGVLHFHVWRLMILCYLLLLEKGMQAIGLWMVWHMGVLPPPTWPWPSHGFCSTFLLWNQPSKCVQNKTKQNKILPDLHMTKLVSIGSLCGPREQ
jgi:hypothetical protein